jgi:hypothetical protein
MRSCSHNHCLVLVALITSSVLVECVAQSDTLRLTEYKEEKQGDRYIYFLMGTQSISFTGIEKDKDKKLRRIYYTKDGNFTVNYPSKNADSVSVTDPKGEVVAGLKTNEEGVDILMNDGRRYTFGAMKGRQWQYELNGQIVLTGKYEPGNVTVVVSDPDPVAVHLLKGASGAYIKKLIAKANAAALLRVASAAGGGFQAIP